jgi:hypothetical protein
MKARGKIIGRLIVGCVLACSLPALAIENLNLFLANSNVVLSWPSADTESYVVQYRPSLTDTNGWQTLAANCLAATETNITLFTHSNAVQYPVTAGSHAAPIAAGVSPLSAASAVASLVTASMPWVLPAHGSGTPVPLSLYPPGTDLSGYAVYDPVTESLVSASEYAARAASSESARIFSSANGRA